MKLFGYYKTFAGAAVILFLSIYPFKPETGQGFLDIPQLDKAIHFLLYCLFSLVLCIDLSDKTKKPRKFKIFTVFSVSFLLGVLLELIQHYFIPERSGSIYDVLANTTGCILGLFLFYKVPIFLKFHQRFESL